MAQTSNILSTLKRSVLAFTLAVLLLASPSLRASEAGSSHYLPGMIASFIDFPSGVPFNVLTDFNLYTGSAGVSRQFPIAGQINADVSANYLLWVPIFQYDLPNKVLGGHYAFTLGVPILDLDVSASITGSGGTGVATNDSSAGLSDIYFSPLNLFWKKGNFSFLGSFSLFVPSGSYHVNRLANLGKNYWTLNPSFGFQYNNQEKGIEANLYLGYNYNTTNNAIQYKSGQEIYLDYTVDKRFKNGFGVGITGNFFQQVSGDSGAGAVLGSFKGRTVGIGPEFSLVRPLDKGLLFAMEGKWLPEVNVKNRLKGNNVWFKFGFIFN